jgi:hypothetical protein
LEQIASSSQSGDTVKQSMQAQETRNVKPAWEIKSKKKAKGKSFLSFIKTLSDSRIIKKDAGAGLGVRVSKKDAKEPEKSGKLHVGLPCNKSAMVITVKKHAANGLDKLDKDLLDVFDRARVKDSKKKKTNKGAEVALESGKLDKPILRDDKNINAVHVRLGTRDVDTSDAKKHEKGDKARKTVVIDFRKIFASDAKSGDQNPDLFAQKIDGVGQAVKMPSNQSESIVYFGNNGSASDGKTRSTGSDDKAKATLSGNSIKTFQEILRNDLVSNTRFILREGGGGEIRIELKPESLGKLKFKVNLDNNRIEGKIFVENSNVKELVEQSIGDLSHAFMEEGFDSVNIQVSLGGENRQNADYSGGYESSASRALDFEKTVPRFERIDLEDSIINLVV